MYIFIDANIYLDYFRMSNDTVVSLKKLKEYIKQNKKAQLILPTQIQNEFYRNKNAEIKKSLELLNNSVNVLTNLSRVSPSTKVKEELEKFRKEFKSSLTDKNSEINTLIGSLFELANKHEEDDFIFNKAYKRMVKRNPPGKNGSIGDAIAWEVLLQNFNSQPLYVISKDGDWGETNSDGVNSILLGEWKKVSSKKLALFKSIGDFLNKVNKANKVKISKEVIKEEKSIPSFASGYSGYPGLLSSQPIALHAGGYINPNIFSCSPENIEAYSSWVSGPIVSAGLTGPIVDYDRYAVYSSGLKDKKKKEK